MLTDADCAIYAAAAYSTPPAWTSGDVHVISHAVDGALVISPRGTVPADWADWARDFDAAPAERPQLGTCYRGPLLGAEAVFPQMHADIAHAPIVLTGHSLGASLAIYLAAMFCLAGNAPLGLVTFGAPRCGFASLRAALSPVKALRQYRNGRDPVPFVPPIFEHVAPLIQFGDAALDPIADHSIALYGRRLAQMPARAVLA